MTSVAITPIPVPPRISANPATTTTTLNSLSAKSGWVFMVPQTGYVTGIGFKTGTFTAAADLYFRIETVSTSTGQATGTLIDPAATGTFPAASLVANSPLWVTINSPTGVYLTQGTLIAVTVQSNWTTGSIVIQTSDTALVPSGANTTQEFPYTLGNTGAIISAVPCITLEYSTGIVCPLGCGTPQVTTTPSVAQNAAAGMRFMVPFDCTATGVWLVVDGDGQYNINLYAPDGVTVLRSITTTPGVRATTGTGSCDFTWTPITLSKLTYYRLAIMPTTATTSALRVFTFADSPNWPAATGLPYGVTTTYTSATTVVNEASWTQVSTQRAALGLYLSAIEIPTPANAQGNMNGGFA